MNSFHKSNLQNIKKVFEEKTGVELEHTPVRRSSMHTWVVIAAVLVCCLTMMAFAVNRFSSLSGDDLSLSSVYEGNGIVLIQVENKSDLNLQFQKKLKLMRWSTSEEIPPLNDNIIFEGTEIKANSDGTMTIDLSAAYDLTLLEQPLLDDHYYLVLTNNNFMFGQDWMCTVKFAEPILTDTQEPTPMTPAEADAASVAKIPEELRHYFDTFLIEPSERKVRDAAYLSDCAKMLANLDGHVVSPVAPYLAVNMWEPGVVFDSSIPADKQAALTDEHYTGFDAYHVPIGATAHDEALVLGAIIPQHKGEVDGGASLPLIYIMTYKVDSIQSAADYAFIHGQLLTFAEMEQYKVYEDEKHVCFNVTNLFYSDLEAHVDSMLTQFGEFYFDDHVWQRVENIYNRCMDQDILEKSFAYIS